MGEQFRGGRSREKKYGFQEQDILSRSPEEKPTVLRDLSDENANFVREVIDSIDFPVVKSIIETMLAKSDVTDPKVHGYPAISPGILGDASGYSPELDMIAFNPEGFLASARSIQARGSRWTWYIHRVRNTLGLYSAKALKEEWRSNESFRAFVLYAIFHELMHGFSRVRLDPRNRHLETGYSRIGSSIAFEEGVADLSTYILTLRYMRIKGMSHKMDNEIKTSSLIIHYAPYFLNAYIILLLSKEIAKLTDTDHARVTDAILRGHFNEGKAELYLDELEEKDRKRIENIFHMRSEMPDLLSIIRNEFGVTGSDSDIWNKGRKEIEAYVESASHTSLHAERYSSPDAKDP